MRASISLRSFMRSISKLITALLPAPNAVANAAIPATRIVSLTVLSGYSLFHSTIPLLFYTLPINEKPTPEGVALLRAGRYSGCPREAGRRRYAVSCLDSSIAPVKDVLACLLSTPPQHSDVATARSFEQEKTAPRGGGSIESSRAG